MAAGQAAALSMGEMEGQEVAAVKTTQIVAQAGRGTRQTQAHLRVVMEERELHQLQTQAQAAVEAHLLLDRQVQAQQEVMEVPVLHLPFLVHL